LRRRLHLLYWWLLLLLRLLIYGGRCLLDGGCRLRDVMRLLLLWWCSAVRTWAALWMLRRRLQARWGLCGGGREGVGA
jgi:hypothetical protein